MSLAEFAPTTDRKRGPSCTAGVIVAGLNDTDRAELERWVTARHTWAAISDSLGRYGIKVAPQTLSRHFGTPRRCQCADEPR